jgi:hypothetical protein
MATKAFGTEGILVDAFIECLDAVSSPWGRTSIEREFDYRRGRTDVVAVTAEGKVLAFEAKLCRWRDALNQAYRNLCFADLSFVVLPKETAERALQCSAEFSRRGVGVCYVCATGRIVILHDADEAEPLQLWLRDAVVQKAKNTV